MSLKVIKRKNRKNYYIKGWLKGKEYHESTGTHRRDTAELYRIKREKEILSYGTKQVSESTFSEAVISYLNFGGKDALPLKKINPILGGYKLKDIDQSLIDSLSKELYPNYQNSSLVRHFYTPICSVINHAADRKMCEYKRFKKPKVIPTPPKWYTKEDFDIFLSEAPENLKIIAVFLAYTGCRVTEALNIRWEDVNIKEATVFIPKTKTRAHRTVYLPKTLITHLRKNESNTGRVFSFYKSKDSVNQALRRYVNKLNKSRKTRGLRQIDYLSSHKLGSHTYATWMRKYAKQDLQGLVGTGRWKDIRSVAKYQHTVPSEESKKSDLFPEISDPYLTQ